MKGFAQTAVALAASAAAGLALALVLPLAEPARIGAVAGVLVSLGAAIPGLLLKARVLAHPAPAEQAMAAMAVGIKAMASGLVLRLGFLGAGLYLALKVGLSGPAFAVGFFGVYFALQAAELRWLLSSSPEVSR